jgi:hypothetical protein
MQQPSQAPVVRILDETGIVATEFGHVGGQWRERLRASRAQRRFQGRYAARRRQELAGLTDEEQWAAQEERSEQPQRDGRGHSPRNDGHRVQLIGDEPFSEAHRPELWARTPLPKIPGYREVYDLGPGHVFRVEVLWPVLDAIYAAGRRQVTLRELAAVYEQYRNRATPQ